MEITEIVSVIGAIIGLTWLCSEFEIARLILLVCMGLMVVATVVFVIGLVITGLRDWWRYRNYRNTKG